MQRILTNWWFVSISTAVLAILFLCVGLPTFMGALRPVWLRLLIGLGIALLWAALRFLRRRKGGRASAAIAAELSASSDGDAETAALSNSMAEALKTLQTANGGQRRDYLYSRPWYVIIGPPGAGKTTALVNSGLRFPYSIYTLLGVGGTRNLEFMFADEAVMVDTAGRYTSQDSDAAVDARGWDGFLALLRRHRPLQPINGIIVAIGVDELVAGDRQSIDLHATTVRRRLAEVRRTLEIDVPVYVLITKADLLSGFVEYYDDLDVEGRRAVLGHTLPFSRQRPESAVIADAFDTMARAIEQRRATRLANEPDATRRALILGFPGQINRLRARLVRFLDGVFVAGDAPGGTLRGFYLTSGVQQGTPLDRMVSTMADAYDQPHQEAAGTGRAYFLNRLLAQVTFPEAGLVMLNPQARLRQRAQLTAAIAGIGVVAALTVLAWTSSFVGNRNFQSALVEKAQAAGRVQRDSGINLIQVRERDPGLDKALGLLRALRTLPQGYADRQAGGAPLTMRFGLFESALSARAEESYRRGLRRVMLPRLLLALESDMRSKLASGQPVNDPLNAYLMLGGQDPVDKKVVRSWALAHWANVQFPGPDNAVMRKELAEHLDALLEDDDLTVDWPKRQAPIDGALIDAAREASPDLSLIDRPDPFVAANLRG